MPKHHQGFSLIETMLVLAVIGTLAAWGVPALGGWVANARMTSAGNDLLTAVLAGHAESVKRRARVTLCRTADSEAATPACDGGSGGYHTGWIVFSDDDGDGVVDSGTDEVIVRHGRLTGTLEVIADAAVEDGVQFTSAGTMTDLAGVSINAHLLICDDRGNEDLGGNRSAARAILLTRNGRARLFKDLDYISALGVACP
jgi:type IV fimbrial biogenesis protein FimT